MPYFTALPPSTPSTSSCKIVQDRHDLEGIIGGRDDLSSEVRVTFKKLINDPFDVVDEALEGFVDAHSSLIAMHEPRVVVRRSPAGSKVGIVVGGGSGHEPAFSGYVGLGMADAAACGNIFASPPPDVILSAIRAANHGEGVLMAYGNYAGDVMNFGLAAQLATAAGGRRSGRCARRHDPRRRREPAWGRRPAGQRPGRDRLRRPAHHVPRGAPRARVTRPEGGPRLCRRVHHLARDGGGFGHGHV